MKNLILALGVVLAISLSLSMIALGTQVRFANGDIYKVRSDKNYLSQTEALKRGIEPSADKDVYEKLEIHERYYKTGLSFDVKRDTIKVETFYEN